ncbi:MAG: aminodeoxychorismate/anthranilate synthase component II, partial [Helicobacter sp.]|nr:aminodeoxychorismate/anthranilate synthase component II [Helicobacter sp.]
SFTYNLYYYFQELGALIQVVKNDSLLQDDFVESFDFIVISPGFGSPKDSGSSLEILHKFSHKKILGVCLGMQCIAESFGGKVEEMRSPMHAKTMICEFVPNPLCKFIKKPLQVALYHSLYVSKLGECQMLGFIIRDFVQIPMIIKHKNLDIYGVQFHPESILQVQGKQILKNFLEL